MASTSHLPYITTIDYDSRQKPKIILPEIIRPFPRFDHGKNISRGRQPGKIKILTKTPEKPNLNINYEPDNKKMKVTKTKYKGKAKKK